METREVRRVPAGWPQESLALAAQASVLSGNKLDQLVRRLQRQTGRSREACWRFVLQYGLNSRDEHRRWTEAEVEELRDKLPAHSVDEIAKMLGRTPNAVRCALRRNNLRVREIRCDTFSIDSLARLLHVRKSEVSAWIEKGWLEATTQVFGKRQVNIITPEAFRNLYANHLRDLLDQKRISSLALFEAFYNYCFVPKHTIGSQLLTVRSDKRERAAFAVAQDREGVRPEEQKDEDALFNPDSDAGFFRQGKSST